MKSIIILCGGRGKRMGQDKGLMLLHGRPLILRVLETVKNVAEDIILVLRDENQLHDYQKILKEFDSISAKLIISTDIIKDQGPLMGIYTGLKAVRSNQALVVPCDSPLVTRSYMEKMFDFSCDNFDALVPKWSDGRIEPLHAIYNKSIMDKMSNCLKEGKRDVKSLLKMVKVRYAKVESLDKTERCFWNLNKPEDMNKIYKQLNE